MKTNSRFGFCISLCLALFGLLACAPNDAARPSSASGVSLGADGAVTIDQTATAASAVIATALAGTQTPNPTVGMALVDTNATKTVEAQGSATDAEATRLAQPTATLTPDIGATETKAAQSMATSVAATLTAQPTATLDQAVTQTRLAHFLETSVAATLTAQPQPIATDTPAASRQVVAYRTNEQALQGLGSLWNLTTFRDLYAPGVQTYNVSITPNQDWRWSFAWCAINSTTLGEILQPLTVTLLLDEHVLSNSDILQHQAVSNNGDQCFYWSTVLTNWQLGTIVKLEIRYSLTSEIDDGRQNYAAGQYQQVMFVNVR